MKPIPPLFVALIPDRGVYGPESIFLSDVHGRRMIGVACGASVVEALRLGVIAYGRPDCHDEMVVIDGHGKVVCGKLPPPQLVLRRPALPLASFRAKENGSKFSARAMRACIESQTEVATFAALRVRAQVVIANTRRLTNALEHQLRWAQLQSQMDSPSAKNVDGEGGERAERMTHLGRGRRFF